MDGKSFLDENGESIVNRTKHCLPNVVNNGRNELGKLRFLMEHTEHDLFIFFQKLPSKLVHVLKERLIVVTCAFIRVITTIE